MSLPRRDALRLGGTALASLTALTGCVGTSGMPETDRPNDSVSTADSGPTLAVERQVAVPELVALNSPDSIGTFGERAEQFLLFETTETDDQPPSLDAFELRADEHVYEPVTDIGQGYRLQRLWQRGSTYVERSPGWLVFRVPNPLHATVVKLRWPDGEAVVSNTAVDRLTSPPTTFAVREFSAPESVRNGEEVTLTVRIENTGDVDGTFVGALNRIGPSVAYTPEAPVRLDVPAGETTTWTHSHSPSARYRDDTGSYPDMHLSLDWRGGSESVDVSLTEE